MLTAIFYKFERSGLFVTHSEFLRGALRIVVDADASEMRHKEVRAKNLLMVASSARDEMED